MSLIEDKIGKFCLKFNIQLPKAFSCLNVIFDGIRSSIILKSSFVWFLKMAFWIRHAVLQPSCSKTECGPDYTLQSGIFSFLWPFSVMLGQALFLGLQFQFG